MKKFMFLIVLFTTKPFAANVFYNETNFLSQINFFSPVGQTFLVTNPNTLFFGFNYRDCNAFLGAATISFSLFQGEGVSGTPILQDSFQASPEKNGMVYFDVSSVNFIANTFYTVQVASSIERGCYRENVQTVLTPPPGPNYPDGQEVYQGNLNPDRDFKFHLLDDAVDLKINATHPNQVLQNTTFNINVMLENLSGSTSNNTKVQFNSALNILSTLGCQEDPNGYPLCTISNLTAAQNTGVTLLASGQTSGMNFFDATISNDTYDIDSSNNLYSNNVNILSESIFVNGFE